MTQPCKLRRGLRPADPVCASRRCHPSFLGGKDAPLPLCRGFAVLRSFCETFAFLCYARLRHKSTEYIIIHSVQKGNPPPSKSVFLRSTKRPAAAYPRNRRADVSSFWLEIFGTKFLFFPLPRLCRLRKNSACKAHALRKRLAYQPALFISQNRPPQFVFSPPISMAL